jgi:hypothetical protein
LGITTAAVLGFLLNLLANLYYGLFVVKTIAWDEVDSTQASLIIFLLFGVLGFLQFFIDDYKNELDLNKSFWDRYIKYFFYNFSFGKIIRVVSGIYLLIVLFTLFIALAIVLFAVIGKLINYWVAALVVIVSSVIFIAKTISVIKGIFKKR